MCVIAFMILWNFPCLFPAMLIVITLIWAITVVKRQVTTARTRVCYILVQCAITSERSPLKLYKNEEIMVEITWKFSYGSNGMKACNRQEKTSCGITVSAKSVKQ